MIRINSIYNYDSWPWADVSDSSPEIGNKKEVYPKVSIIIPSFNQGAFIEETLRSIIYQNYPNLELIVIDGGSKDNTVEIIKKYEKYITYWVSEPDSGQSHAINKGFIKATGEWIAWINSDDCYLKGAFQYLFVESNLKSYDFLFGNCLIGEGLKGSREVKSMKGNKIDLRRILCFFYGLDYIIPSQSVFVKKDFMAKAGVLNENLHYCMDLEWYARIFMHKPKVFKYDQTICFFRYNDNTKTALMAKEDFSKNIMAAEAEMIALKYSVYLNTIDKWKFRNQYHYYLKYLKDISRHERSTLGYLFMVLFCHPIQGFCDRRLLGLLKRKLLSGK